MMTLNSENWFTEVCKEGGSAFSFELGPKGCMHEEQSEFQKIQVFDTRGYGNLMVIDGFIMLTDRDNFLYHEMMSHPALFSHPHPRNVLVIGGGDCGTLREVLRHQSVERADQVEIDERVTRVSEQFFPELCESNNDPRAGLHFTDGIKWVKDAEAGSYDVIIVDSTDPIGPAEGLFQRPFYESCYRALGDNGILVQQSESPLYHMKLIKDIRTAMQDAGFTNTHTMPFPQPVYPSGWWSATMAFKNSGPETFRRDDISNRNFDTRYYNLEIHLTALSSPEFMKNM